MDDHSLALEMLRENRLSEAEELLTRLTRERPRDGAVWNTLGTLLVTCGEAELAINAFEKASACGVPPTGESNLLFALHTAPGIDAEGALRRIVKCGERFSAGALPLPRRVRDIDPDRRLRIGYLCAFDLGSTRYFAHNVFHNHDSSSFETFVYLNSPKAEPFIEEYGSLVDSVRSIYKLDDEKTALLIWQDDLDLLVDLCGHAERQRLSVLARRPAPLQATWIESFFSTGIRKVNYLITDPWHTPVGGRQRFVEQPFRLPVIRLCYTPPSDSRQVGPLPARSCGHITFGSFNHLSKLVRPVTALWSSILQALPDARLILKWRSFDDRGVCERVRKRFASEGIQADRIELRGFSPHAEMLEQYNEIDIALDPFPYNGGLTTCEAMWMGVPVLSLRGDQIISRQSAAISETVGLKRFTADDESEYRELAVNWAGRLDELEALRGTLRDSLLRSPLCDAKRFTSELERAYRMMIGVPVDGRLRS